MIHSDEAAALDRAGYRLIRALRPGRISPLLLQIEATSDKAIAHRLDALSHRDLRAQFGGTPHALEIYDLVSTDSGALYVIEEYARHGALGPLLSAPGRRSGECVTALVPVLEELEALAESGIVPLQIGIGDLLLDADGRVRIGSSAQWRALHDTHTDSLTADGYELQVRRLVSILGAGIPGCADYVDSLAHFGPVEWAATREWLRSAIAPEPFRPTPSEPSGFVPTRFGNASADYPVADSSTTPAWAHWTDALKRFTDSARDVLRSRRAIRLVAFGSVLCVAVFAGLLWVTSNAQRTPVALASSAAQETIVTAAAQEPPGAAAARLFTLRASCEVGDSNCVTTTDEVGSALAADDVSRLAGALPLAHAFPVTGEGELISVMGDAALVRVHGENATASVLIVQTEAGWRIRDVFD